MVKSRVQELSETEIATQFKYHVVGGISALQATQKGRTSLDPSSNDVFEERRTDASGSATIAS